MEYLENLVYHYYCHWYTVYGFFLYFCHCIFEAFFWLDRFKKFANKGLGESIGNLTTPYTRT